MAGAVNRGLSDQLRTLFESLRAIVGVDDNGDLNVANIDSTGALSVALENVDLGVEIQVDTYMFQNLDEAGDPQYYGYVREDGEYYIMKLTTAGVAQYFKSDTSVTTYDAAWTARAAKTYTDWDGTA